MAQQRRAQGLSRPVDNQIGLITQRSQVQILPRYYVKRAGIHRIPGLRSLSFRCSSDRRLRRQRLTIQPTSHQPSRLVWVIEHWEVTDSRQDVSFSVRDSLLPQGLRSEEHTSELQS